jgi:NADPH:quinone reductase-like Zn-dependent oxidoreductase
MRIENSNKMKAVTCIKYGPPEVLQIKETEKPTPKDDEVLIRIYATAVTASDIYIRSSQVSVRVWLPFRLMMGLTKPKKSIQGLVLAGEIESAGKDITRFKPGDKVFGLTGFGLGAYAEYKCMKERDTTYGCLALKPENLDYAEATTAAYGGLLALQFMEKGNVRPGQQVLIYGASGTTGTTAIQFARYLGAEVTAVCSTANILLARSLGAKHVIDYTKQDSLMPKEKFDFILDAVGKNKSSLLKKNCKKALYRGGKYVSIDDSSLKLDSNRLQWIKELVEAEHIIPIVDKIYPLERIVEAHKYVGKGHKRGGVAITVHH